MSTDTHIPEIGDVVFVQTFVNNTPGSEPVQILCRVTDKKHPYGRWRIEVSPVAGQGRAWVWAERVIAPTRSKLRAALNLVQVMHTEAGKI